MRAMPARQWKDMLCMNKALNEKGLTLVEILAVIVISSIIMIFAGSLIVQSMKNQERITAEAQLRDEADIVMAKLMKAIFTLKESEIDRVECGTVTTGSAAVPVSCITESDTLSPEHVAEVNVAKQAMTNCSQTVNCSPYAFVYLNDGKKIGFQGDMIFTKNEQFKISNKNIRLTPYYTVEMKEFEYKKTGKIGKAISITVAFQLSNEVKKIVQSFQNEIVTVDDQ